MRLYKGIFFSAAAGALTATLIQLAGHKLVTRGYLSPEHEIDFHLGLFFFVLVVVFTLNAIRRRQRMLDHQKNFQEMAERQLKQFAETEVPDKMVVNAAMDRIIESQGTDIEAIRQLIIFASKLPPIIGAAKIRFQKPQTGWSFRGLTDLGEVEVQQDQAEGKPKLTGIPKEPVGQYLVWRTLNAVFFQYFWAADIGNLENPLQMFEGHVVICNNQMEDDGFGEFSLAFMAFGFGPPIPVLMAMMKTGSKKDQPVPLLPLLR